MITKRLVSYETYQFALEAFTHIIIRSSSATKFIEQQVDDKKRNEVKLVVKVLFLISLCNLGWTAPVSHSVQSSLDGPIPSFRKWVSPLGGDAEDEKRGWLLAPLIAS